MHALIQETVYCCAECENGTLYGWLRSTQRIEKWWCRSTSI